jgi:hypothetical protein
MMRLSQAGGPGGRVVDGGHVRGGHEAPAARHRDPGRDPGLVVRVGLTAGVLTAGLLVAAGAGLGAILGSGANLPGALVLAVAGLAAGIAGAVAGRVLARWSSAPGRALALLLLGVAAVGSLIVAVRPGPTVAAVGLSLLAYVLAGLTAASVTLLTRLWGRASLPGQSNLTNR